MTFKSISSKIALVLATIAMAFSNLVLAPSPAHSVPTLDPNALVLEYTLQDTWYQPYRTVNLPLFGTVNATINWGDGTSNTTVTTAGLVSHVYAQPAGTFDIQITGSVGQFGNGSTSLDCNNYLKKVLQFGNLSGLTSLTGAFSNARYLTQLPTTLPAGITDLSWMLKDSLWFNGDISGWDTSSVTNMSHMFQNDWSFNQNISSWNTSNVTNMSYMFGGSWDVGYFNQNIGSWDVSKVTDMSYMFQNKWRFNQDISNWNTANVTDMQFMFSGAQNFNQPLPQVAGKWDTTNVTNMSNMFNYDRAFNQPIDSWNVAKVTNMTSMFYVAENFNQSLNSWNVSAVTTMTSMFANATRFNGNISSWNVSNVTNFSSMFQNANAFNADISAWNTGSATTLASMFNNANAFNADISAWNVSNVTSLWATFAGASSFNQNIGSWNVANVTTLNSTFDGARFFNQDITGWNTAKVTTFFATFSNAASFNQAVGNWNTAAGTTMAYMFRGAVVFDQPLVPATGKWNTSNVTDMQYMFSGASVFNHSVADWDTLKVTNMEGMFQSTGAYNLPMPQVTGKWVTTNVTDMAFMFDNADAFNLSVASWDTSKVTTMRSMFQNTLLYNVTLPQVSGYWTTANVTDIAYMFNGAQEFDQDLSSWDTSKVQTLEGTFAYTEKFNHSLTSWNTSAVTNMYGTFAYSKVYNQPIPTTVGGWTTGAVTQMSEMFKHAYAFNQSLNTWDVSQVVYMNGTFMQAVVFDNNISAWNTGNVREMYGLFKESIFNQDISQWDTSRVYLMSNMFENNTHFNLPIDDWNTSSVNYTYSMFHGATAFNQPIYKWNMSANVGFYDMFSGATSFDMDLSSWDTSHVNGAGFDWTFNGTGLWPAHYSAFLDAQANGSPARPYYLALRSSAAYLCEAEAAHIKLTNSPSDSTTPGMNWWIYDGGKAACKTPQTLTFQDIDNVAHTNTFPVNKVQPLTSTATSGLTVTYKWISGPCQVSGNKLTANPGSVGKVCVIAAQQHGDSTYSDAVQKLHWITVTPAATEFAAIYDGNGAESGSVTDSTVYLTGETVTVKPVGNLLRANGTFTGWNTKADGTGTPYSANQTITVGNEDVLLFAQWDIASGNYAYSITYDKGTGDSGTLAAQTGNSTSVTLSSFNTGNMVKAGYHFTGWVDESENSYTDGQVITLTGAFSHTLTAQWAADGGGGGSSYSYSITYDKGTGDSGTLASQTGTGSSVTLSNFNSGNMVKAGYHFTGWVDESDNSYTDGQVIPLTGAFSHTLTAQWAADGGGGGGGGGSNGGGSSNPTARPDRPDPSNVTVSAGNGSLTVNVGYTGSSYNMPTHYTVTLQPGGNTCEIYGSAGSCTIDGLAPGTDYTVTIVAKNDLGGSTAYTSTTRYMIFRGSLLISAGQKSLSKFASDSAKLTPAFKSAIKSFVNVNSHMTHFTCTGYIAGKAVGKLGKKLAKARAIAVCNYIHSLRPSATITTIGATPTLKLLAVNRKVVIKGYVLPPGI